MKGRGSLPPGPEVRLRCVERRAMDFAVRPGGNGSLPLSKESRVEYGANK